jgi:hypothetical protein
VPPTEGGRTEILMLQQLITYNDYLYHTPMLFDDGHGDYNRSYDKGYEDFDYADYSTGKEDNNFRTQQKKKRKTQKQIIEDILNRWD